MTKKHALNPYELLGYNKDNDTTIEFDVLRVASFFCFYIDLILLYRFCWNFGVFLFFLFPLSHFKRFSLEIKEVICKNLSNFYFISIQNKIIIH